MAAKGFDVVALLWAIATAAIVAGWVGFILGSATSEYGTTAREQQKAIKAGVGRWVIDAVTGTSSFVYGAKE